MLVYTAALLLLTEHAVEGKKQGHDSNDAEKEFGIAHVYHLAFICGDEARGRREALLATP